MGFNEPIYPKGSTMNNNLKTAVTAVAGVAIVGAAIKQSVETRRAEQAKRRKIKEEAILDLRAITRARLNMSNKIADGGYQIGSLGRLQQDMQTEIEFQKIAIREDSF